MTDQAALAAERARLRAKLAKREGREGYESNVRAIRARLAEIEAALETPVGAP